MKLPKSYYNLTSYIGTVIAAISLFLFLAFVLIGYYNEEASSYLGLLSYIVLPAFLILGLLLIPVGMYFEFRKTKKRQREYLAKGWPVIDLNVSKYRNAIIIFSVGTVILFVLSAIGSYEAYHYTESNEFCGTVCHEVMEPEYTAYQNSPHARVKCVACHVGSGADWYMRSKLSGLRQVYGVITGDFERPIETPIEDMRPARETCERCHWPEKYYARELYQTRHFLADSTNTEWNIALQMKTGPDHSALGLSEGIHWHNNPDVLIEYIPKRANRKKIPWVRYINLATGDTVLYEDVKRPLKKKKLAEATPRTMDCMDCHNRPAHNFYTPQEFIDHAIVAGDIPQDLPYIKRVAMEIFMDPFDNKDTAIHTIKTFTWQFYKDSLPAVAQSRKADINKAINGMINEFNRNIFPAMEASWDTYEKHIGHKTYNGCFRCHDDKHKSADGKVISKDCDLCHTIVMQGEPGREQFASIKEALDFIHPKELKEGWEDDLCSECHRYLYD